MRWMSVGGPRLLPALGKSGSEESAAGGSGSGARGDARSSSRGAVGGVSRGELGCFLVVQQGSLRAAVEGRGAAVFLVLVGEEEGKER